MLETDLPSRHGRRPFLRGVVSPAAVSSRNAEPTPSVVDIMLGSFLAHRTASVMDIPLGTRISPAFFTPAPTALSP